MENRKKALLGDYFPAVERRIRRLVPAFYDLEIRMGRYGLRFHFQSREQKDYVQMLYTGLVRPCGSGDAHAEFFCWSGDLTDYLPAGQEGGVWSFADGTGFLKTFSSQSMIGGDFVRNHYYACLGTGSWREALPSLQNTLYLMFRWAWQSDMMLIHGAAVGTGGKGILLGGSGGAGKSTLAVSCLLRGMDFSGDDYILLSRKGPAAAMPFFHTVRLCPDMEEVLRPDFPLLDTEEPGGKKLLDASGMAFCPLLPISCIVLPVLSEEGKASIREAPYGQAAARMIRSSMNQFGIAREMSVIREMTARLGSLPAYEMRLSRDPEENALCLETFIAEML